MPRSFAVIGTASLLLVMTHIGTSRGQGLVLSPGGAIRVVTDRDRSGMPSLGRTSSSTSWERGVQVAVTNAEAEAALDKLPLADDFVMTPNQLVLSFTSKHPGGSWMVNHDDVLKLNPDQRRKVGMLIADTKSRANKAKIDVQLALDRFDADAAKVPADAGTLAQDLKAIGLARASSTNVIIESNLSAYDILDAKQKEVFDRLIKCCGPPTP